MLADPAATLLECLQHIVPNQPWNDAMLKTAVDANSFRRKSDRDPGQSSSSSFLRKGQAGTWRKELDPAALTRLDTADQYLIENWATPTEASQAAQCDPTIFWRSCFTGSRRLAASSKSSFLDTFSILASS